jgi:hypothetical protein
MLQLAIAIILLTSLTFIAFGVRYLLAREYMPYHAQVTQRAWAEVPELLRAVILGMLKVVAAGLLALGIAVAWLTLPLSRGELWASWAILSITLVNGSITLFVTISLRRIEPTARTPIVPVVVSIALVIVAVLLAHLR